MSVDPTPRPLIWMASSLDDLKQFPAEVRSLMGYALYVAQCGLKHEHAKPSRGLAVLVYLR
jgi:phage-related protein